MFKITYRNFKTNTSGECKKVYETREAAERDAFGYMMTDDYATYTVVEVTK